MRKISTTLILAAGLCLPGFLSAQGEAPSDSVQVSAPKMNPGEKETAELFDLLKGFASKRNYPAFARHMAYSGTDINRKYKTPVDFENPFEKVDIQNAVNKLGTFLEKSTMASLANYHTSEFGGNRFVYWDAQFTKKNGKYRSRDITFIRIHDKYYFVSIR